MIHGGRLDSGFQRQPIFNCKADARRQLGHDESDDSETRCWRFVIDTLVAAYLSSDMYHDDLISSSQFFR